MSWWFSLFMPSASCFNITALWQIIITLKNRQKASVSWKQFRCSCACSSQQAGRTSMTQELRALKQPIVNKSQWPALCCPVSLWLTFPLCLCFTSQLVLWYSHFKTRHGCKVYGHTATLLLLHCSVCELRVRSFCESGSSWAKNLARLAVSPCLHSLC